MHESPTKFGLIQDSPLAFLARCCSDNLCIGEINQRNDHSTPKNKEKLAGQSIYSEKCHKYISSERIYVARCGT